MKLSFREIADRITGFSTPVFGVSWNPPVLEVDVAKRLITYLEDRRALYNPYELEMHQHVVQSIIQIRERLTRDLEELDRSSGLSVSIAAMRAASRKFLDSIGDRGRDQFFLGPDMVFFSAVGELRGVFGIHIARICVQYGIDVESDLAAILPAAPELPPTSDARPRRASKQKR